MSTLAISRFGGARPGASQSRLEDWQAALARDCDLSQSDLRPLAASVLLEALPTPRPPARAGQVKTLEALTDSSGRRRYLQWNEAVTVSRSSESGPHGGRLFVSGQGAPKVLDAATALSGNTNERMPAAERLLGVPAPERGPEAEPARPGTAGLVDGKSPAGAGQPRPTAWTTTFVTDRGEEGPPSAASPVLTVRSGQAVVLHGLTPPPPGRGITTRRVYRTLVGGESGSAGPAGPAGWFFVGECPASAPGFLDAIGDEALGELLQSRDWAPPPPDLRGLVVLPGGFLAGFRSGARGRELRFSEPHRPHAWPPAWSYAVERPIRGLAVVGQSLIIATSGPVYVATGSDPRAMSLTKLPGTFGCVAPRALAVTRAGAVWPTADGLCLASERGAWLISKPVWDSASWRALKPHAMHATATADGYVAFHTAGAANIPGQPVWSQAPQGALGVHGLGRQGLSARPAAPRPANPALGQGGGVLLTFGEDGAMSLTTLSEWASACCADLGAAGDASESHNAGEAWGPTHGDAPLVVRQEAASGALVSTIWRLAAGSETLPYLWRSKTFRLETPTSFAAARIAGDFASGSVTFTLLADGQTVFTRQTTSSAPFRLPAGKLAETVAVELSGKATVREVVLATSMEELA